MGPPISYKSILCNQNFNCTQRSSRSLLQSLLDTPKRGGENKWSRIWSRARYVSMQHMHPHLPLGLPCLLRNLVVITTMMPNYKPIRRMALPSLPIEEQRETWHRRRESEIWLVNWEPRWEAKMTRSNPNYVKWAE
jgi:hypothetical protein